MSKVVITIDPATGDLEAEVEGIPGSRCKDITTLLTQGLEVLEDRETEEYFAVSEMPEYIENM